MQAINHYQKPQYPSLGSHISVNGHGWDHQYSNLEQGSVASGNSVKCAGYEPFSKSMATYLTDTCMRHQPSMNEASNPASRYIKYNRLLQQCLWPITFNKTCIWKVDKLACRIAGIILAMVQSEQVLDYVVCPLDYLPSVYRTYIENCFFFFNISHITIKNSLNSRTDIDGGGDVGGDWGGGWGGVGAITCLYNDLK